MPDEKLYWAVTGRIPHDDEDTPFVTPEPCTRVEADAQFRAWMINTALEDESETDLRQRLGIDATTDLTDHVYVISMFRSATPIFNG